MRKVFFSCLGFDLKLKSLMLLLCITSFHVQAAKENVTDFKNEIQKRTITGVVKDNQGVPLPGANVIVKGTTTGVVTDFDGEFELNVDESATTLVITYVGFEPREIAIGTKSVFSIILNESQEALDEVVIVGFGGAQKKASVVSSITTISPKEIKGPTSNLTTMMAGRVSGMIAFQRSGEPGSDNSDFFIRGLGSFGSGKLNPLILIDNIESTNTDMARLQPDDIESFSVLKDAAAAAVYGARGANGVVLIVTKKGKAGKTSFSFRSETSFSSNTQNFKFADNITYMNLANEAYLTRDPQLTPPYNQNKIFRTSIGDNEYLYPNNNWIDELIKDYTVNSRYNISAQGGGEKARYYISGTYNIDNGVLNVEGQNNFNNNIKLRNYSLRSNVDVNLTPTTKASVNLYGQFDDYNGPLGGVDQNGRLINGGQRIFNLTLWSNPVLFPKTYPESFLPYIDHPLFGGAVTGGISPTILVNPYAEMVRGYQVNKTSTVQTQVEFNQDLGFITEGLTARAMGYVRRYSYFDTRRAYNPFYYSGRFDPDSGTIRLTNINSGDEGSIGTPGQNYLEYFGGINILDSRIHLQTALNYARTFNEVHEVTGMLINYLESFESGNAGNLILSLPNRNHGISGRFTYGYDSKYFFEFNFGYNGSERFAKGSRYGYFPSLGFAYNISNENFWEPIRDVVSDLKFRFTYGLVGNDQIGAADQRFFYLSNIDLNSGTYGASFGEEFTYGRPGVFLSRYANPNIGWEESRQINIGLDLELFKDLGLIVDAFRQNRTNILQARSNIGATLGLTSTPITNFAEVESSGLDATLTYNKSFNEDWYTQLRGNFTYATNEFVVSDEINYPDELSYRSVIGNNTNQVYGYIAERLFVDDDEVANAPAQFGDVRGGDIKYRDVNGDDVINANDLVPIGYPTVPEIVYGFGGTLGYKNFDISAFFQGVARTSLFINAENIAPFVINGPYQNGLLEVIANDHWSETNRDSYAFWPRLSNQFEVNNNQSSTWWMRDGSFLRLKSVEAGYNFPESFTDKLGMQGIRLYFSGTNLAIWSKFRLWDPEMGGNGLGYPIQQVYNIGLKVDF
ncbi:SusC/RagA family TonB-linked outer membrane protein [Tamlana flava]|uniref:SusC/RagA family TonB-linked outer membrane protein n=1 Tax=Tamlana flava TaxID=3158572 RepID=UPI00351AD71C